MSDYTALLPPLDLREYEALKADIAERGCLVPVELDENGDVLDGAHRKRVCAELGIKPPTITRRGLSEDEKRAHAIALNLQRRQLDRSTRAHLHRELRKAGKSLREIAEGSGASKATVERDVSGVPNETPDRISGRDGKSYPAKRPAPLLDFPEQPTQERGVTQTGPNRNGVHYSSATDEWATPQDFFDLLDREFGFDCDVCALDSSAKCDRYFTPETDGLAQEWTGTCWMNPPYGSEIAAWVEKAHRSAVNGATVVCLVPARVDTGWWWDHCRFGEIRFLRGRLKFGDSDTSAPFPSALVVFGPDVAATVKWWER